MDAKEMLYYVEELKDECILNNGNKTIRIEEFFNNNWMQILDILDDALYEYVNKK